jgi:predicted nucleic acid-binding Zn ribbon protein
MKVCQWCDNSFDPKVSYQIYCSDECREQATKEKVLQKYLIAKRNKLIGKTKSCKLCGLPLSVYNDEHLCSNCLINPTDVSKTLKEIKRMANGKDLE